MGNFGENVAKDYLEDKGYKVVSQNYENKWGETDLICQQRDIMVFVEVKTRATDNFGGPESAITNNKIKRLIRNSMAYMKFNKIDQPYRIDVVCIVLNGPEEVERINHYENITM